MSESSVLLEVVDLRKHFPIQKGVFRKVVGHVKAVDLPEFDGVRGVGIRVMTW